MKAHHLKGPDPCNLDALQVDPRQKGGACFVESLPTGPGIVLTTHGAALSSIGSHPFGPLAPIYLG